MSGSNTSSRDVVKEEERLRKGAGADTLAEGTKVRRPRDPNTDV